MVWLEVETGDGVVGLGETFYGAEVVEAYIHAQLALIVLGLSAHDIEAVHYTFSALPWFCSCQCRTTGPIRTKHCSLGCAE
jgi:L-alanine-DL-glutamate epimerase-like enolase superfamily enzyme